MQKKRERIVLIYNHYYLDAVYEKTSILSGDEDDPNHPQVYHIHEDDTQAFIDENGHFTKILFTGTISQGHKELLSNPPYNGEKMS